VSARQSLRRLEAGHKGRPKKSPYREDTGVPDLTAATLCSWHWMGLIEPSVVPRRCIGTNPDRFDIIPNVVLPMRRVNADVDVLHARRPDAPGHCSQYRRADRLSARAD
jgi:hypothetical protein